MSSSGIQQTPTGMLEFHEIPLGIHWNGWDLPLCRIPMESKWNSVVENEGGRRSGGE